MAERKFDISWIAGRTSADGPTEKGSQSYGTEAKPFRGYEIDSSHDRLDSRILGGLGTAPDSPWHVVDLAQGAGVEFDDALRSVLRLAARRELKILERDPIANDHVVQLTDSGRKALHF